MPTIAELQNDPKFQELSPEAKNIVFEKMSSQDTGFSSLSDPAKEIVRGRILGQQQDLSGIPSISTGNIPEPGKAEPTLPYMWDQFKKGVVALPDLAAKAANLVLDAPGYATEAIDKVLAPYGKEIPGPRYSIPNVIRPGSLEPLVGVENLPIPKDQYGKPNKADEYLGAISNFIGLGLVPGIGVINASEHKLIAATVEILGAAVAGTSAVEGKEVGKAIAKKIGSDPERGGQIGEFIGSIFGPGIVAGIGRGVQKGTQATARFVGEKTGLTGISDEAQAAAGKALAVDELKASLEANPLSGASLKESAGLQKEIPGFKPTLGQASGAPGVIAIEQRISNQSPQSLAKAAEREQENLRVLNSFKEQAFPIKENLFQPSIKREVYQKSNFLEKNLENIQSRIEDLASKYQYQDNVLIGEKLRLLRNEAAVAAKNAASAKYEESYNLFNKAGFKEDMTDIGALTKEIVKDSGNTFQVMPPVFSQIITKYSKEGEVVSFKELHSLYKRANADLTDALIVGDSGRAFYIGKVKDALEEKITKYAGTPAADKFLEANNFYKQKYAKVFKEGAGGKMAKFGRFGETTNDEDIVRKLLFTPNNAKGMEDFTAIYGNSPEATQTIKNGIFDIFAKEVVRDGEIKPKLVESFMRRYDQSLKQIPSMKSELSNINKVNDQLLTRRALVQEERKLYDTTVMAKISRLDHVDDVVNKAISDRQAMLALLSQGKKNPDTAQSIARYIADRVMQEKNPYKFLTENADSIKPAMDVLGKNHYANLEKLAKAQGIVSRVKVPTSIELQKLQDIGEKTVGTPVKSIFSNIMYTVRGYQSKGYMILNLGGRYIYKVKQAEANKLLEEAIYDPKLAQALVDVSYKPVTQDAVNSLRNHAYSHGIRIIGYASEDKNQ